MTVGSRLTKSCLVGEYDIYFASSDTNFASSRAYLALCTCMIFVTIRHSRIVRGQSVHGCQAHGRKSSLKKESFQTFSSSQTPLSDLSMRFHADRTWPAPHVRRPLLLEGFCLRIKRGPYKPLSPMTLSCPPCRASSISNDVGRTDAYTLAIYKASNKQTGSRILAT